MMPTYYVRAIGGSNANDGLSFANGWATIQFAENQVAPGDLVLICNDGSHDQTAPISMSGNSGTAAAPITFAGANNVGVQDGSSSTVRVTAALASGDGVFAFFQTGDYTSLERLIIDANGLADHVISHEQNQSSNDLSMVSCELKSALSHGIFGRFSYSRFYDCDIHDNGGSGFLQTNDDTDNAFDYCNVRNNGGAGIVVTGPASQVRNSIIHSNGGDGILMDTYVETSVIEQNTIFGNTGNGIGDNGSPAAGHRGHAMIGNSLVNNGGYGYERGGLYSFAVEGYNHTHNNTLGPTDLAAMPGIQNITGDPYFRSTTPGAENFSPAGPVSPLWEHLKGRLGVTGLQLTFLHVGGVQTRRLGKVGRDSIR